LLTTYSMDLYYYNAKLDRIIDGDTIDAMVDLGFDTWVHKRIRLSGINCPETRTRDLGEKARGLQSKLYLEQLFLPTGGRFILQSLGVGKYGRCLGNIYIDKVNINELLLKEGYAEPYKGK
jgi:micrococcal nuclease